MPDQYDKTLVLWSNARRSYVSSRFLIPPLYVIVDGAIYKLREEIIDESSPDYDLLAGEHQVFVVQRPIQNG